MKPRFKVYPVRDVPEGYTLDRWLLTAAYWLFIVLLLVNLHFKYTHAPFYWECSVESPNPCKNPFVHLKDVGYLECKAPDGYEEICARGQFLPQGTTLGDPQPWLIKNSTLFGLILLLGSYGLNHFLYNRRFPLWKKLRQ